MGGQDEAARRVIHWRDDDIAEISNDCINRLSAREHDGRRVNTLTVRVRQDVNSSCGLYTCVVEYNAVKLTDLIKIEFESDSRYQSDERMRDTV